MSFNFEYSRRSLLQRLSVGAVTLAGSNWFRAFGTEVTQLPKKHQSIIMLWMNGGPATIDLWDLKSGHANGGPFKELKTTSKDVCISEHLPNLAKHGERFSIIRSMSTREGDHQRARILHQTGYTPQGAIQFPAIGSVVAHEHDNPSLALPGYVAIGSRGTGNGGGFLGPRFAPFVVGGERADRNMESPRDLKVADLHAPDGISAEAQTKRLDLLMGLEKDFAPGKNYPVAETMRSAIERAVQVMRPEAASAFRLEDEKAPIRDAYGRTMFGQGCLLARRLVERGVSFVEVTLDGWDTHNNNFDRVKTLSQTLDTGFAALLTDLKERGLLDSTLIVCQGEFGRTPKINSQTGRDHWPTSWSAVLAGAGIKGGQTIGKTSPDGTTVESTPTRTADLLATIIQAVGLDPMKQNMSNVSRPIRLADPAGKAIKELL